MTENLTCKLCSKEYMAERMPWCCTTCREKVARAQAERIAEHVTRLLTQYNEAAQDYRKHDDTVKYHREQMDQADNDRADALQSMADVRSNIVRLAQYGVDTEQFS